MRLGRGVAWRTYGYAVKPGLNHTYEAGPHRGIRIDAFIYDQNEPVKQSADNDNSISWKVLADHDEYKPVWKKQKTTTCCLLTWKSSPLKISYILQPWQAELWVERGKEGCAAAECKQKAKLNPCGLPIPSLKFHGLAQQPGRSVLLSVDHFGEAVPPSLTLGSGARLLEDLLLLSSSYCSNSQWF